MFLWRSFLAIERYFVEKESSDVNGKEKKKSEREEKENTVKNR